MNTLQVVGLVPLMERTGGRPDFTIGLIDGPVLMKDPDLWSDNTRLLEDRLRAVCVDSESAACGHGTAVASILATKRGSGGLAICPDCTLLVRPIFSEVTPSHGDTPQATSRDLAHAIIDCVNSGAQLLNISAALANPFDTSEDLLGEAMDYAAFRGSISVAAAGNQGTLTSTIITRHPSVIPVTACDLQGRLLGSSNVGHSIGRRGLMAPGQGIRSVGTNGKPQTFGGTSAAAAIVTGTIALLWTEFPSADANQIRLAVTQAGPARRRAVAPPLLNAWGAYQSMRSTRT